MLRFKNVEEVKDVAELVKTYDEFCKYFCLNPNKESFPCPNVGEVLDENMSVKWNQEEVERLRNAYEKERVRLMKEYDENKTTLKNRIKELLAEEYGFNKKEVEIIWNDVYQNAHSQYLSEMYCNFKHLANLYIQLKKSNME